MTAYYNEIDPYAAQWLRNLISAGHIAPGDVDERSIVDVRPDDIRNYTQCHFFAGIGVWSYALRRSGWPDDRPVWTGSCPCQPFSAAGKGEGFADERHLWPFWHYLIEQCRPANVFGEQVASKDGLGWLDLVQSDLEGAGYACWPVDLCAAGVGAPHIRQRLWFVGEELEHAESIGRQQRRPQPGGRGFVGGCGNDELADTQRERLEGGLSGRREKLGEDGGRSASDNAGHCSADKLDNAFSLGRDARGRNHTEHDRLVLDAAGPASGLADARSAQEHEEQQRPAGNERGRSADFSRGCSLADASKTAGPTNGHWRAADWLFCRDGKWRPVRPSAQQMADGSTSSLGRVCTEHLLGAEKAVSAWALRHQRDATKAVRDLWDALSQEEVGQRTDGGFDSVREAPFLLAFLRQLTDQGWRFQIGHERASSEASQTAVRVLRYDEEPCYSSRGRGLDEQQSGEPTDPLRQLSQIVAYHTEKCWGQSGWQNVGSFPLARNAPNRVGRLRAYGNAIVAQAAQAVIETYMEHRP